jgi:PAS domain S-box-containing protein
VTRTGRQPIRRPETALLSEHTFRAVCDRMPGIVVVYNYETGKVVYCNKALKRILGYAQSRFTKGGIEFAYSLIHPDDTGQVTSTTFTGLTKANSRSTTSKDKETIVRLDFRMRHADGHYVWLHVESSVFDRIKGRIEHVLNVAVDISDRMDIAERAKTELKLRASEERYQAFIRNSSEAIWRCELDKPIPITLSPAEQVRRIYKYGYLAESNQTMAKMYGLDPSHDLSGTRLTDLLIQSDPNNTAYLKAFIESGYSLANAESHEIDSDGNDKYFVNSLVGVIENDCLIRAWGTQQDITEQRAAVEALKQSEAQLGLALEASEIGLWEWDMTTNTLIWSEKQKHIFGLPSDVPVTYELYVSLLPPEQRKHVRQTIERAIKNGEMYQFEHQVMWQDGSRHWIMGQGRAFYENGKAVRMIGTSMNIDERKHANELELTNKALHAEHKLLTQLNTAKDEIIGIASHQLRTPATAVKQYLSILLDGYVGKLNLTTEQKTILKRAHASNERQLKIINDLLKVAQVDAGHVKLDRKTTDMNTLLHATVQDSQKYFEAKQQTLTIQVPKQPLKLRIDATRMRMVLDNLLNNASKYSPEMTTTHVSLKKTKLHTIISITDSGVGIDPVDHAKLFQKFSRVNNPLSVKAGGTGLGLYWAKKIIALHDGSIDVKSEVNNGATFSIKLPN